MVNALIHFNEVDLFHIINLAIGACFGLCVCMYILTLGIRAAKRNLVEPIGETKNNGEASPDVR